MNTQLHLTSAEGTTHWGFLVRNATVFSQVIQFLTEEVTEQESLPHRLTDS